MSVSNGFVKNIVPEGFESFHRAVALGWSRETSVDERWGHASIPRETGQCAVTAMLVQDYFGGEILRGVVKGYGSHYWNRVEGVEVDFTRAQFTEFELEGEVTVRDREYLTSNPETLARYTVLRERVFPEGC